MSLYEKVHKDVLGGLAVTRGPKGWWGSSDSQGLKTSETGRNTEREERDKQMGRDGSHGR